MTDQEKPRCPSCGGSDVRHSLRRGAIDAMMEMFNRAPYRCRACERRFYRFERQPEELEAEDAAEQEAGN